MAKKRELRHFFFVCGSFVSDTILWPDLFRYAYTHELIFWVSIDSDERHHCVGPITKKSITHRVNGQHRPTYSNKSGSGSDERPLDWSSLDMPPTYGLPRQRLKAKRLYFLPLPASDGHKRSKYLRAHKEEIVPFRRYNQTGGKISACISSDPPAGGLGGSEAIEGSVSDYSYYDELPFSFSILSTFWRLCACVCLCLVCKCRSFFVIDFGALQRASGPLLRPKLALEKIDRGYRMETRNSSSPDKSISDTNSITGSDTFSPGFFCFTRDGI